MGFGECMWACFRILVGLHFECPVGKKNELYQRDVRKTNRTLTRLARFKVKGRKVLSHLWIKKLFHRSKAWGVGQGAAYWSKAPK